MKHRLISRLQIILVIFLSLITFSCDEFLNNNPGLDKNRVAQGLKEALKVGTDTAVAQVSVINGFFGDALIKILLPQEATQVIQRLNNSAAGKLIYETTLKATVDKLILSINRSAEDASKKAAPIFISAINTITIDDAINILYSTDTAATFYLKSKTFTPLTDTFKPEVSASLNKLQVGTQSANSLWNTFVTNYNSIAKSPTNVLLNLETIKDTDLSTFVTHKALQGLFYKVGQEEKSIRTDVTAQVTDILKEVFGKK